jgi:hypothetical protein
VANPMDRSNRLAFVKAAATQIPSDDDEVFEAFDAAECALEDGAKDAEELFLAFCELLDARGIVVKAKRPAYTAREIEWMKTPRPNRGKLYR